MCLLIKVFVGVHVRIGAQARGSCPGVREVLDQGTPRASWASWGYSRIGRDGDRPRLQGLC